ncbi:MAG: AgmX/PglI C-terminal domain-containing protein, partial [Myxococcota bacterium]
MASPAPPPLKKRRREERADGPSRAMGLDLSLLAGAEASSPGTIPSEEQTSHDDAATGEWLFKQDNVVLGPVPATVIAQRIRTGEMGRGVPIGREAGRWKPLESFPYFRDLLDQAEEERSLLAERQARARLEQKNRVLRFAGVGAMVAVPFLLGGAAGHQLLVARPWDTGDQWVQRVPPLVDIPARARPVASTSPAVEAPAPVPAPGPASAVVARVPTTESGDDDGAAKAAASPKRSGKKTPEKRTKGSQQKKSKDDASDDGGAVETLTQAQVMAPFRGAQGAIGSCLKAEVARNPSLPPRVTLMLTVTEQGKATNFALKEREVRQGPLATCLEKVIAGMRWPKFTGERKNLELPLGVK